MEAPPTSGWSGKHAVELYVRTYTTMLQSSGDIKIESLVQAHLGMGSVLHPLAAQPQSDMGALLYAVRRLPAAISRCRRVVMGQSPQGFKAVLGAEIMGWEAVKAPARRRRWYHDGKNTLAVLIASTSDIDDLVPTLVAFQIEAETVDGIGRSDRALHTERPKLEAGHSRASRQNWLYYGARQVFGVHPERERLRKWRAELEAANGVRHIPAIGTGVDSA